MYYTKIILCSEGLRPCAVIASATMMRKYIAIRILNQIDNSKFHRQTLKSMSFISMPDGIEKNKDKVKCIAYIPKCKVSISSTHVAHILIWEQHTVFIDPTTGSVNIVCRLRSNIFSLIYGKVSISMNWSFALCSFRSLHSS